jgi:hypothetical protein
MSASVDLRMAEKPKTAAETGEKIAAPNDPSFFHNRIDEMPREAYLQKPRGILCRDRS